MPSIPLFKVLVNDLDEAVAFYVGNLGMKVREDQRLGEYRWVLVGYPEQPGFGVNLDLASSDEEKSRVGRQSAGQPLFGITTDNCYRDYETMRAKGVQFEGVPEPQPWGISVTFRDVVGNRIHLSQDA